MSRDGLHWEPRYDLSWARPDWHSDPPIFGVYDRHTQYHSMTIRPGWGDRRRCLQSTDVLGKIVRLEVRFRRARVYSFRGHFHFIDAQDRSLIEDGKPLPS